MRASASLVAGVTRVSERIPLAPEIAVREPRPDWPAVAGLIAAGVLNLAWISFLFWMSGHLLQLW